jgi:hypothetical protein
VTTGAAARRRRARARGRAAAEAEDREERRGRRAGRDGEAAARAAASVRERTGACHGADARTERSGADTSARESVRVRRRVCAAGEAAIAEWRAARSRGGPRRVRGEGRGGGGGGKEGGRGRERGREAVAGVGEERMRSQPRSPVLRANLTV